MSLRVPISLSVTAKEPYVAEPHKAIPLPFCRVILNQCTLENEGKLQVDRDGGDSEDDDTTTTKKASTGGSGGSEVLYTLLATVRQPIRTTSGSKGNGASFYEKGFALCTLSSRGPRFTRLKTKVDLADIVRFEVVVSMPSRRVKGSGSNSTASTVLTMKELQGRGLLSATLRLTGEQQMQLTDAQQSALLAAPS